MFIDEGIKRIELEDFLKSNLEKAGFTKLDIVKTPLVTRIVVNVTMPGLAIGKSGQNIRQLTETIEERFKIDNPQLEIKEVENASLNAAAVANKLKALIEKGFSWRSISYRIVKEIMNAGAQGVEIVLSGKLAGKGGRKKKQRIAYGYMKKVGDQTKLVDYAKASAYPKAGAIGIKVKIVGPNTVFPDKIKLDELLGEKATAAAKAAAQQTTAETKEEEKKAEEEKAEESATAGKKEETEKKKENAGESKKAEKAAPPEKKAGKMAGTKAAKEESEKKTKKEAENGMAAKETKKAEKERTSNAAKEKKEAGKTKEKEEGRASAKKESKGKAKEETAKKPDSAKKKGE